MSDLKKINFLTLFALATLIGFAYAGGGKKPDENNKETSSVAPVKPTVSGGTATVDEQSGTAQNVAQERASKQAADQAADLEVMMQQVQTRQMEAAIAKQIADETAAKQEAELEMLVANEMIKAALRQQELHETIAQERAAFEELMREMDAYEVFIKNIKKTIAHGAAVEKRRSRQVKQLSDEEQTPQTKSAAVNLLNTLGSLEKDEAVQDVLPVVND